MFFKKLPNGKRQNEKEEIRKIISKRRIGFFQINKSSGKTRERGLRIEKVTDERIDDRESNEADGKPMEIALVNFEAAYNKEKNAEICGKKERGEPIARRNRSGERKKKNKKKKRVC